MTATGTLLYMEKVSVSFDGFRALNDLSLAIAPGEMRAIIGPNGAGKTTTLKLLSKITRPTAGRIEVGGRVSALIELGAGFHPDLTGRENVYLNGAILGLTRGEIDRKFDSIVDFSGLAPFIDTPVKRYSSGMYVRLGFAVAAHVEPQVLLVDEVLSVGDAEFRQKCAQRIEELRRLGTTIVLISHNLYLVRSVCDLACLLIEGRVMARGDVISVTNAYEEWSRRSQPPTSPSALDTPASASSEVVEIRQVEILGGCAQGLFRYDDPLDIVVQVRTGVHVRKPNLVIRIQRVDGVTCCRVRTRDHGHELRELNGDALIRVRLDPIQLAGGTYSVQARLFGEFDGLALAEKHSPWFEVKGPSFAEADDDTTGVYVPKVVYVRMEPWHLESAEDGINV